MSFLSKQNMLTGDIFTTATVVVAVVSKSLRLAVQKLGRKMKQPLRSDQILVICCIYAVPTKTQLSNFLGTPGEDYFKGNPKS